MLSLAPITLKEANRFVLRLHRHNAPVVGHKFSISAMDGQQIVGVCIVGRPVSRKLDDGNTLEVVRLATNGSRNACSFLYGAAWRAAKSLGYSKIVTYTLQSESGASLRAVGWSCEGKAGGSSSLWATRDRQPLFTACGIADDKKFPTGPKLRWSQSVDCQP